MTETATTVVDRIREGGEVVTVAGLIRALQAFPPDLPVVVSTDGPDPSVCCPVDWTDHMGYCPESTNHGNVHTWDAEDADGPDHTTRVVVVGHRGVPDEFR